MSKRIGVHLRVTGDNNQGGRKYMEDCFSVAYQHTEDQSDLEYAYFGIFDGHGGSEAALYAKHNLMDYIVAEKGFWSADDDDVLSAIREGFIKTHKNMWRIQDEWPKTASGLPSTAGTTASIAFVRHGKIYTGHVGDSGIILGYQSEENSSWLAMPLTEDHKPESAAEKARIESNGGKVVIKSGVPRVVWNKPRIVEGHKGPIRRNTPVDEVPFLAVARSLGDLWSYNPENNVFVVSPEPDVAVRKIDVNKFRCLIFGTDGLWNMVTPQQAITMVEHAENHNRTNNNIEDKNKNGWINPSKRLVEEALARWGNTKMHADNITVVALMLDPPGTPKRKIVRKILDPQTGQHKAKDTESCNTFCSNESASSIPVVTPSLQKNDIQNIITSTANEENANTKSSDKSTNPANISTPYDTISDMKESKNTSDTVCTNFIKMDIENVDNKESVGAKCADEEEPPEDYSSYMIDFNKEYITNVIFGPLPNNTIYPEPIFTNLSGYDNATNSAPSVKTMERIVEEQNSSESNKNSTNDENKNIMEVNLNATNIPKSNHRKNNLVSDSLSAESITKLHETVTENETNTSESTLLHNDVALVTATSKKSESIQIHEISSSCASQDIVKQKVKGHKLQKPRNTVTKRHSTEKTSEALSKAKLPRTVAEVSKRRSGRNQQHDPAKLKNNKDQIVFQHALEDPKLNNSYFPIVLVEKCFPNKIRKSSDIENINLLQKIKANNKTKFFCGAMTIISSKSKNKVHRSRRHTRSKTQLK